ncbi:MAG: DUF3089 domain-containing protein [Actinomycetes bacterium]
MSITVSNRVVGAAILTGLASVTFALPAPSSAATASPKTAAVQTPPNYAKTANWMLLPRKPKTPRKSVDLFYLYPTEYQKTPTGPVISPLNDPGMRTGALAAYQRGASAFAPVANVYAPWYRQADAMVALNLPPKQHSKLVKGVPTHDALAAFKYYLKHYNHDRPFILAGHSQGSEITLNILTEYLSKHPKVLQRMVVAYVIGYSVTPKVLKAHRCLKFAKNATDTGVIVSYNTEAPVIGGPNPVVLPGALAINPISWKRSQKKASAKRSLGSRLPDSNGTFHKVMDFTGAQVSKKRGAIIASKPDVNLYAPGNPLFPKGVYHPYDYPFYYFNLRANAQDRVHAYWLAH